jgi:glycosyltransferase involved in cell wall biosynthesis
MYAYPGNWDKLDALGQWVDLAVITPSSWPIGLHPMQDVPPADASHPWKQYRLDTYLAGNPFRYVYDPKQLASVIAEYRPGIVHVEQEPESLAMLQFSLYKLYYHYRLLFVAWENVNPLRAGWLFRKLSFALSDGGIFGNRAALSRCRRLGFRKWSALIPQYGFETSPRRTPLPCGDRPLTIGYAGRLVPEKGIQTLVEAVRRLPGSKVLMVGEGPLEASLGRERQVCLLGKVARDQMQQFWDSIDVLVLPSLTTRRWAEQFGRVLGEAMAAGVPVVGSSSGAIPEVIGDAGLIFPEGDAAELAAALTQLNGAPDLYARLVEKGYERVRQHYSNDVIMGRTVRFYEDLFNAGAVHPGRLAPASRTRQVTPEESKR